MALMTKIRENMTKMFAVFAVLFIAYMVLDWGMELTSLRPGGSDVVGKVNGEKIRLKDFSELLNRAHESQKTQTGVDVDEEAEQQIRSQVWNMVVTQTLVEQEMGRLGVAVTDKEIVDLVRGANPPEDLVRMFRDSTGRFNRDAYDRAIADPQNRQAWVQVEQQLRQQKKQEKLQSFLFSMVRVTEGEIRQRFADRHISIEADYALLDPTRMVPDSMIVITEDDLQRHYRENQEEFKVRPSRKLKYAFFSNAPSSQDTAEVLAQIEHLKEEAERGDVGFLEMAKTYSEIPATEAFYKHGDLSRAKESVVFSTKKGQIAGPIRDFDGLHLIKVVDERKGKEEFVRASHILIPVTSNDSTAALKKAREILSEIRSGRNFAEMARKYGSDGSAPEGGDLGWGKRETWVKSFSDAAFRARVGEVVGPVRTQFGWHLIKVTGRDNRELKLIDLAMRLKASSQSVDAVFQSAQDFAYLAKEEGYEKAAENSSLQIRETPEFVKGGSIPGIGVNDAVMNFAFHGKVDDLSDPIRVSGGVAVFKISFVREEGVRPFDEVKNLVRTMVLRKKKLERLRPEVDVFHKTLTPETDLVAAAQSVKGVIAQKTVPFKAGDAPAGVGRDPKFIGVALALKVGEISKPFEGVRGFYILKLTGKTPFDSTLYTTERNGLRDQILQEKRSRLSTEWLTALREKADIEDYRNKFYR